MVSGEARVIFLGGPTASGKSDVAIEIAMEFPFIEIVNADSVQLYKYMDIGSAKVGHLERSIVPHHLIDVAEIDDPWDVKRYEEEALKVVDAIQQRGNIPLVVGGSGFYMFALESGVPGPIGKDEKLREKLYSMDTERLYEWLNEVDPERAREISKRDKKRIVRALELYMLTGEKPSKFKWQGTRSGWRVLKVAVTRERKELKDRITKRVYEMVERGWLEEVRYLVERCGKTRVLTDTLGYRELLMVLDGALTIEEAVREIIKQTYKYAKRQIGWFKGKGYEFFKLEEEKEKLFERIRGWLDDKADRR
ncbi:MAG: tRNA (adenosine(37)-N6)-dimethylallyltransferase MiaA [Thermosulfidibacteraceae bacterium]